MCPSISTFCGARESSDANLDADVGKQLLPCQSALVLGERRGVVARTGVRELLLKAIATGKLDKSHVARSLNQSPSTLQRRLRRAGTVDASVTRQVLRGNPAVMVLRNGERLAMPGAANEILADGDELSVLTPMAGG